MSETNDRPALRATWRWQMSESRLDAKRRQQAEAREQLAQKSEPVADFDSRRRARESAAAAERANQQRARLAETRTVHAPLTGDQSQAARAHRQNATARAETHRKALRITNCNLCDDDGYRGSTVCDHREHSTPEGRAAAKAIVRRALNGGEIAAQGGDQ